MSTAVAALVELLSSSELNTTTARYDYTAVDYLDRIFVIAAGPFVKAPRNDA
jgi:hypothetical protein